MSIATTLPIRLPDLIAIVVYLGVVVAIGLYFARRNQSTEEYFVGSRSFSGWVLGLSMLGTIISSATFLALPAAAYVLDWRQLVVNLSLPLVAVVAIVIFIPFFRQGKLTSAFEYLGRRYGAVPRLYGTMSFVIMQLIRMAQILFLVSIPIQFLTGWSIVTVIIVAGLFVAFYTVIGGIDAVIWTDVLQTIVLFVGGIICVVIVVVELPGGMGQIIEVGMSENKFSLGSTQWNIGERTFWTVLILGIVNWLTIYSGDQNLVQRYAAARSTREARKATALYSALALPLWTFFFFIGTAVFAYYRVFPDEAVSNLEADEVFPRFILTTIPAGVAGIVIAAIMAAAMSSLDSGVNAISTVITVDLIKPYFSPQASDKMLLRGAQMIACIVAVLVVSGAIIFSSITKESMNDASLIVTSAFGGCLMGMFLLGFFTTRVDGVSVTIAMVLAIAFNVYLVVGVTGQLPESLTPGVHSYWVGPLVNLFFLVVAYGLSLIRGRGDHPLQQLTVWTLNREREKGIGCA